MQAVLHLWLGQRPVSEQAKKLVPLKRGYKVNKYTIILQLLSAVNINITVVSNSQLSKNIK